MIKLIKRYPLVCMIIGVLGIGMGGSVIYSRYQAEKMQISLIQESDIDEDVAAEEGVEEIQTLSPTKAVESTEVEEHITETISMQPSIVPQIVKVPVYICGQVQQPGVYYVDSDAIINDVIQVCGGFTKDADVTAVNLASPIIANEKIVIPKEGEEIDKLIESYDNIERNEGINSTEKVSVTQDHANERSETYNEKNTCVNINTASKETLRTLPGIGEVKAAAIIAYREEHGAFSSKEEIKNVSGIGDKTYEKLASLIMT